MNRLFRFYRSMVLLMVVIALSGATGLVGLSGSQAASHGVVEGANLYLPLVLRDYPWPNPFGVEVTGPITSGSILLDRATELRLGWVRLNDRISWREMQPVEGGPIQWDLPDVLTLEDELRALKAAGMTPIVIVDDYPLWAVELARSDGQLTSCGPLKEEYFDEFAAFVGQLVQRYSAVEFNVHNWEFGNEPDVDPDLVPLNNVFGCWGDIDDPFYGGQRYGNMLKMVSPVIRQQDSAAVIWIGGLLLANPNSPSYAGKPEWFLKGILEAGAAPYFDIVPYHFYPSYSGTSKDYDLYGNNVWNTLGGGTVGKARYLRQLMQEYGVEKPVFLNETGLGCMVNEVPGGYGCTSGTDPLFEQAQADYIVRSFLRGLNEPISGFVWYTLNGVGWRYTGLLRADGTRKPVYLAYQNMINQLHGAKLIGAVTYSTAIEAYEFRVNNRKVQVVWAIANTTEEISIPQSQFEAAFDLYGNTLTPTLIDGAYHLDVGFSPVFVVLK